ncbi:DnaJ domain-containing protein [bacterium]|nr:DnaJ domain-containing protein [bacterium]
MKDYYEILEVHPRASQEVIKKAYLVLSKRYHPDAHDSERAGWAEEKFKVINEAFQTLGDLVKRKGYDLDREGSDDYEYCEEEEVEIDEKAYFHYRLGLDHFEKTDKRRFMSVLLGSWQRNLKLAQKYFLKVVRTFPTSYYTDQSQYHYIVCLMREYDYSEKHAQLVEKETEMFLKCYPESECRDIFYYQLGQFYLLKRQDYNKAIENLKLFLAACPESSNAKDARCLLKYTISRQSSADS